MNYDSKTTKVLTDLLSNKIGEKFLAKEIIQMKMELEDEEIMSECINRFEENLENGEEERGFFDNLAKEVSRYPNLTTGFIERHIDLIDWDILAAHQKLPESFWLKNKEMVSSWGFVLEFQDLSKEALEELYEILQDACLCDTSNPCDNCIDHQYNEEYYSEMYDYHERMGRRMW